jgi:Flp pilus assembly pilin Flp
MSRLSECLLWCDEKGQDIAEYAVMLAVILVIVVGTIRLVGSNANNVFSSVASAVNAAFSHEPALMLSLLAGLRRAVYPDRNRRSQPDGLGYS